MSENTSVKQTAKISAHVEKVFRAAKVGDRIAYLTFSEQGGIYKVTNRTGQRGIGGTIVLSLEREVEGKTTGLDLDMRRDGPQIATMALLRERKPRTKKNANMSTEVPFVNSEDDDSQDSAAETN